MQIHMNSDFEMNDIFTIALHLLGGFQNIHDNERANLIRSLGNHRNNLVI